MLSMFNARRMPNLAESDQSVRRASIYICGAKMLGKFMGELRNIVFL